MNPLIRLLFFESAFVLLLVLLALRVFYPESVVSQPFGLILNVAATSLIFSGIIAVKKVRTDVEKPSGRYIAIISALFASIAIDVIFKLNFLYKGSYNALIIGFMLPVLVVIAICWWKILWKNQKE